MGKGAKVLPVVFGLMLAAGIGIRLIGRTPLLSADMVYKSAGKVAFPGADRPGDAAVSFYMYIDRGLYDEAAALSMEPDFTDSPNFVPLKERVEPDMARFQGPTPKEEFVRRLRFELGPRGSWIRLHNIRASLAGPVEMPEWVSRAGVSGEGDGTEGPECTAVRVTGHLLGACTIFSWEKTLPVIKSEGSYKVLLPGTKQEKQFFYQDWIMNVVKIFDLRAVEQ